jgi:transposase
MQAIYPCVSGLDVHKKTVVACVRRINERGQVVKQVRTFGTMTRDILALADWLTQEGVSHVAMESTGVYWKPIYHLLEGRIKEILLVNAQHIKHVLGRKTDVKDCNRT